MLHKVLKLRPSWYRYRENEPDAQLSLGFIAQEVEGLFPELVYPSGEYKALSYDAFSVLAIKAIQEQQGIIEQQETRLQELESEVGNLRAELESIRALMEAKLK